MLNFAVIGVGGYIAPRHLEAIKQVGGRVIAAFDPNDSVGILDRYSPDAQFFTCVERFETFVKEVRGTDLEINYFSICSPNFMHFSHIEMALRNKANVICEKPLVFTIAELERLKKLEIKYSRRVNTILQLRLHDKVVELKERSSEDKNQEISLEYVTSRGPWYFESWKGNESKSGGLSTNIGVHFFDMLTWIWGPMIELKVSNKNSFKEEGTMKLERATVKWMLSISIDDVPVDLRSKGQRTYRSIKIGSKELEFSEGFTELHNESYQNIIKGNGFGIDDIFEATEIVEKIRG